MEIQQFINENTDYLSIFKEKGFQCKRRKGLLLVKHPYHMTIDTESPELRWMRYCRGVLIDTSRNHVISVPPIKSREIQWSDMSDLIGSYEYQPLIDGTMVNLCHYEGEWLLTTRGNIGGHNKWKIHESQTSSFHQMFGDCGVDYGSLDPRYSYSFVMRHLDNRIVSPVTFNVAYLVEMHELYQDEMGKPQVRRVSPEDYPDITKIHNLDVLEGSEQSLPYYVKGYTIKKDTQRYKYMNPNYKYVKDLQPNTNSPYLNYLELRQNGTLKDYLRYYPEHIDMFAQYRDTIHTLSNDLYTTYKNVNIYKTQDKQDIPFHLKPLIYDIHGLYLKDKEPTTWSHIKNYIHSLPPKKLLFAINHIPT